jgi:hypothetical protein
MKLSDAAVEELYSDALPLIEKTISALKTYPEGNATIEARVKGELKYLRQQILRKELAVPQSNYEEMRTIAYAIGHAAVGTDRMIDDDLGAIYSILCVGRPLLKEKHVPWLLEQIHTLVKQVPKSNSTSAAFAERAEALFNKMRTEILLGAFHLKRNAEIVAEFNQLRRLRPIAPNVEFDIPFSNLGWVVDDDVGPLTSTHDRRTE